jgi:hypothetical protein
MSLSFLNCARFGRVFELCVVHSDLCLERGDADALRGEFGFKSGSEGGDFG